MKKQQLNELIRLITRQVLKEYSAMNPSGQDKEETNAQGSSDTVSVDDLSPMQKAKIEREKRDAQKDQVKQKGEELKSAKKEMDFQKQKVDLSKRFTVPNITKDLQRLKGSQI